MARVSYRTRIEVKIFGIKIADVTRDYIEHSTEKDGDDDEQNIDLTKRIIERDD